MQQNQYLHKKVQNILSDTNNQIYLSVVSPWEMIIKKKLGKLKLAKDWKMTLKQSGFLILPITLEHSYALETLPLYHKDPFDRMLVAQAKTEKLKLITSDSKIWKYKVSILKA